MLWVGWVDDWADSWSLWIHRHLSKIVTYFLTSYISSNWFSHIIVVHPYMCLYIRIYLPWAFCSPQDLARHVDALAAAKVEPERTLQSNSQWSLKQSWPRIFLRVSLLQRKARPWVLEGTAMKSKFGRRMQVRCSGSFVPGGVSCW